MKKMEEDRFFSTGGDNGKSRLGLEGRGKHAWFTVGLGGAKRWGGNLVHCEGSDRFTARTVWRGEREKGFEGERNLRRRKHCKSKRRGRKRDFNTLKSIQRIQQLTKTDG